MDNPAVGATVRFLRTHFIQLIPLAIIVLLGTSFAFGWPSHSLKVGVRVDLNKSQAFVSTCTNCAPPDPMENDGPWAWIWYSDWGRYFDSNTGEAPSSGGGGGGISSGTACYRDFSCDQNEWCPSHEDGSISYCQVLPCDAQIVVHSGSGMEETHRCPPSGLAYCPSGNIGCYDDESCAYDTEVHNNVCKKIANCDGVIKDHSCIPWSKGNCNPATQDPCADDEFCADDGSGDLIACQKVDPKTCTTNYKVGGHGCIPDDAKKEDETSTHECDSSKSCPKAGQKCTAEFKCVDKTDGDTLNACQTEGKNDGCDGSHYCFEKECIDTCKDGETVINHNCECIDINKRGADGSCEENNDESECGSDSDPICAQKFGKDSYCNFDEAKKDGTCMNKEDNSKGVTPTPTSSPANDRTANGCFVDKPYLQANGACVANCDYGETNGTCNTESTPTPTPTPAKECAWWNLLCLLSR